MPTRLSILPSNKIFATLKWMYLETIILKSNLFRTNWERSVAFIYYYSSLIYSNFTHEISMRKNFGPTKTHEKKICTHKMPTRKIRLPKLLRGKILDPRNACEKKLLTREIPKRKNLGPINFFFIFFIYSWLELLYFIIVIVHIVSYHNGK